MFVQCYRFTLISTTVAITKQKIGLEGRKDIFSITFPLFKKCKFRPSEGERLATYRSELLNAVRCLNLQHWYRKVCERFVSQVSFYSFCKYQHKIRDRPDSETLCCLFASLDSVEYWIQHEHGCVKRFLTLRYLPSRSATTSNLPRCRSLIFLECFTSRFLKPLALSSRVLLFGHAYELKVLHKYFHKSSEP